MTEPAPSPNSPLPWRIAPVTDGNRYIVSEATGYALLEHVYNHADADFIILAVNTYATLTDERDALKAEAEAGMTEIHALREELEDAQELIGKLNGGAELQTLMAINNELVAARDAALAEVERLGAALREIACVGEFDEAIPISGGKMLNLARAALLAAMGGDGQQAYPLIGSRVKIEHDGFSGTVIGHYRRMDGYEGAVLQQDGTKVVHVYGLRHLREDGSPAAMGGDAAPVAWKYRWRVQDVAWSSWHLADRSQKGTNLQGLEEIPLYDRPPTPSAITEGMRDALRLGSMVEEVGGGKYEILISYRTIDDMFAAGKALASLRLPPAPGEG